MGNSQSTRLDQAVKKKCWERVISLLRDSYYSSSTVDKFIKACERYDVICVDHEILIHCNIEQCNRLLNTAVKKESWMEVKSLLRYSNYDSSVLDQFITACERYGVVWVDELLTLFTTQQLDRLLALATLKRQWLDVDKVLKAGGSHDRRVWVIEQAYNSDIPYMQLDRYILPHVNDYFMSKCRAQQVDRLLTTATQNGRWMLVDPLLKTRNSNEKRGWVFEQTCVTADDTDLRRYILPHCSDDQLQFVLTCLVTRGLWKTVGNVLERGVSDTLQRWVIAEASNTANNREFGYYILPHCSDDQLEFVLTCLVTRGLWGCVFKVLKRGVSDTQHRWAVKEASKTANDRNFESSILPHCRKNQLKTVLPDLVTRGLWESVGKVLERGVSHTQASWAIEEASKTANDKHFDHYILPHCKYDQLKTVLPHLVTRGLWKYVGKVLKRGDTQHMWVVEEASKTANERDFGSYILPHCSDDQLEFVLTHFVTRGMWETVGKVLKRGVSDTLHRWAVEEASKTANGSDFKLYMLPHCSDDQLKTVLPHLVTSGRWEYVGKVLKRGVSDKQHRWAVEEASKTAIDRDFFCYILPRCSNIQLKTLLPHLVTRGLWNTVGKVLKRGEFSDTQHRWAIKEASKRSNDRVFSRYILPHCSDHQSVLTRLVTRGMWESVGMVLERGVSDTQHWWAVVKAGTTADAYKLKCYILPHCSDDQLKFVMTHHVTRGLWDLKSVCKVLESKTADYRDFERYILHHCSGVQLESLLTHLVTQGIWKSVGKVLQRGVSDTQHRWAVSEAVKTADGRTLGRYILPHCSNDQVEYVLTLLMTRDMWDTVLSVLRRGVSDTQARWAVEEASKTADDMYLEQYIIPHCSGVQLESSLPHLVTRGMWEFVGKVLERGVSHTQHRWAVVKASKTLDEYDFRSYILPNCSDDQLKFVLPHLVKRCMWHSVGSVLERGVSDRQHRWAVVQASEKASDHYVGLYILPQCSDDQLESVLTHLVTRGQWESMQKILKTGRLSDRLRAYAVFVACKECAFEQVMGLIENYFLRSDVQLLISSLLSNKLSREAQSVALRFALQQRNWDVISRASLEQVWEQVRRHLFREAVYQRQWTIVKKWADHTLYDDERWWALEEAYKQKQWNLMLQLADHGLTEIELMRVRYRLAKHADWRVVLRMIERGVDVTEIREVVENTMISRKTKTTTDKATQEAFKLRWWHLRQLEKELTETLARRIKLPSTAIQWRNVLFHLHRHPGIASMPSLRQPSKKFGVLLLQRAIKQRAWHLVMHLVRLGIGTDQLDSLLTDMIRRRKWGVCRVLLEQGVSVQSCLSALSVFMEKNQWTLVSRVVEFIVDDALERTVNQLALGRSVGSLVWQCVSAMCRYGMCVGDAVRLQVMQRAMEQREGSVVGECISTMQHYRMSVKERDQLFQQATSRGFLQAVKPLVDKTKIQHRDATMLAAIQQRQWDVVDCCQLQSANIDMKDKGGETPLNREVSGQEMFKVEWKAVEELVVRGAYPNVLDKYGCSILNRAIGAKQWDIVRLLIEYHADIHMKSSDGTPLPRLIDERQGGIIHHTLIWCPDQAKGVNDEGETTLHAIALDKKPDLLYYQIVRGVNPLTLTKSGQSVLLYAVQNEHCPQRMVGECIRLGFSTHQPRLTQPTTVDTIDIVTHGLLNDWKTYNHYMPFAWYNGITSPFQLTVLRGMPVMAHMLYESGSCSYSELLHLYTTLRDISDPDTENGRTFLEGAHLDNWRRRRYFSEYQKQYERFMSSLTTFLPYLREMASTPRSLVSTCRLVISHCLTVRRRRERAVQDLDLTDRMKDFLLFSDLTDPDYQWFLYGTLPPLKVKKKKQNSKALRRQRQRGARRT